MENKKLISVGFYISFLVLSVISIGNTHQIVLESEELVLPKVAANRNPIYINDNSGFNTTNGVSAGDGTFGDPYIIENWVIRASTAHGIHILNTNAYVIIRNCTVTDGGSSYIGIHLFNVQNAIVENNKALNNWFGIRLQGSRNNTIANNTASNNADGIVLAFSSNNTITNNTVSNNKQYGIGLLEANNNTFQANIMEAHGFVVIDSINNTIDTSNKVNGKSVRYFENQNGITLSGETDVGEVILVNCNNSFIENLDISNSLIGIQLWSSSNNTITHNTAWNNKWYGIYLSSSSNNTITNNNASNNSDYGIYLYYSSNNTITDNTISSNEDSGIYLYYSSNNAITNNTASNNKWYGIYLYYSSNNNTITNNTVSSNEISGIRLYLTNNNNTITNNTASNNKAYGIHLSDSSNNNFIENNTLENNGKGCIGEFHCTGNTFNDNICDEAKISGFQITPLLLSLTFAALILVKKQRT